MQTLQTTQLQAIAGGVCFTNCAQQAGDRALYNDAVRPTVIKEAMMSGVLVGVFMSGLTYAGAAALSLTAAPYATAVIAGVGVVSGLAVLNHEYNNHELWFSK